MKLNQVIAVEKGVKSKAMADLDVIDKAFQKPALFEGFIKKYKKSREDEEDAPSQIQRVQANAKVGLDEALGRLAVLFDTTFKKETGNLSARADVSVGGQVVVKDAPVTYLLFLEKQLTDLGTMVGRMPVLDPSEDWKYDQESGVYKTEPAITNRTKKVQKPIVLYPATPEHPAQAQLITEDMVVGVWEMTRFSTAIPATQRKELTDRIESLRTAVKQAREQANLVEVAEAAVGNKIMGWILGKG